MKLLIDIDVYAAMYHGADVTAGHGLALVLRRLADQLDNADEPMTLDDLETFDEDLFVDNRRVGNAVIDN